MATELTSREIRLMEHGRYFGEIPGVPVGTTFARFKHLRKALVHFQTEAGIHASKEEGALSIVLNGGYSNDMDRGNEIWYTGEGKKSDQDPNSSGNAGLRVSAKSALPVRVIRGFKGSQIYSPPEGYRYDGLYTVLNDVTAKVNENGKKVFIFHLERCQGQDPLPDAHSPPRPWKGGDSEESSEDDKATDRIGGSPPPKYTGKIPKK